MTDKALGSYAAEENGVAEIVKDICPSDQPILVGPAAFSESRSKIKPIEELAGIIAAAQTDGKTVVHAHGVFDLLHLGHVRHLEAAKSVADLLVVTVTTDKLVNKGPGRPVFHESQRAEMLAALAVVDYVAVSTHAGAESVIEELKPDFYTKGNEYLHAERDVTGRIVTERAAVERHGGRMVFTEDITFSSSALLNRHFGIYPPELQTYLDSVRGDDMLDSLIGTINAVRPFRLLFVGDTIIDEYQYVVPLGKSAKENIIASRYQDTEVFCGGVVAAANHVADFCRSVDVFTVLGEIDSYDEIIKATLRPNIRLHTLMRPGAPTTRKKRMVDQSYMRKLFEICYIKDEMLEAPLQGRMNCWLDEHIDEFDGVVVTDFGHGMVGRATIDLLCERARFLAVNAQVNSANGGFNLITKYPRADYICIDAPEAQLAAGDRQSPIESIITDRLRSVIECDKFIVTHGPNGCVAFDATVGPVRVPAFSRTVVDTMGAGDAFLAVTAPLVATGARLDHVAFVGNAVGAMKVGIVGQRQLIDRVSLIKYITAMLK